MLATMPRNAISMDRIKTLAPSVFATSAHHSRSERYRFIPTVNVVELLMERGFYPVEARETIARKEDRHGFSRHMLKFWHDDFVLEGRRRPELLLTNAHDGTGAYNFWFGIFEFICSNGLIVASEDYGRVSVRHMGGADFDQKVIDATYEVMNTAPQVVESVCRFQKVELVREEQLALAESAYELKPVDGLKPSQLLTVRRPENRQNDLYTTFNVIQENTVKGGLAGRSASGRRTKTRPVKAIQEDLRLNRALWKLADRMATIKGA